MEYCLELFCGIKINLQKRDVMLNVEKDDIQGTFSFCIFLFYMENFAGQSINANGLKGNQHLPVQKMEETVF